MMPYNSMTSHITEHSVSTRVRQLRSEHRRLGRPKTIVLVEGPALDPLVYQSLFDSNLCHVEPAYGKKNAINAIKILSNANFDGVIAIVDDDFDSLNGIRVHSNNVFPTDTHDIETLIISSSALEKFALHLLPPNQLGFQNQFVKEVKETIIKLGLPLGFIRWYFSSKRMMIDLSSLNFHQFIDVTHREVDVNRAINEIIAKNQTTITIRDELLSTVQMHLKNKEQYDCWLVCQGHDLVKVLSLVLNSILGAYAPREKERRDKYFKDIQSFCGNEALIIKHLAMCYEKGEFKKTVMYSLIVDWEKRNPPYRVVH